jgi:uncharacterized membrane protein
MTHNDFTYKEVLRESYALTKKHFLFLFGLILINLAIGTILAQIPVIGQLISIALSIATTCVILLIAGGHTPLYKDMLRPFRTYLTFWHYFLAMLLVFFLSMAVAGSLMLLGYAGSTATEGWAPLVIAALIVLALVAYYGLRLSFFRFLIVEDENLGPISALKKSLSMTRNRFWKLAGFVGVLFLLNLLGLLAFVIGLIFTVPMSWIAFALVYRKWNTQTYRTEGHSAASQQK